MSEVDLATTTPKSQTAVYYFDIQPDGRIRIPEGFLKRHAVHDGMRFDLVTLDDEAMSFCFLREFEPTGNPVWFAASGEAYVLDVERLFDEHEAPFEDFIGRYPYTVERALTAEIKSKGVLASPVFSVRHRSRRALPGAEPRATSGAELLLDVRHSIAYAMALKARIDEGRLALVPASMFAPLDQLTIDIWQLDERLRDASTEHALKNDGSLQGCLEQLVRFVGDLWGADEAVVPVSGPIAESLAALLAVLRQVEQHLGSFAQDADRAAPDRRRIPTAKANRGALVFDRIETARRSGMSVPAAAAALADELGNAQSTVITTYYKVRKRAISQL